MRQLVDETSATVGLKREHVVPMLKHDHRQLCKHPSSTSGGMRLIYAEIQGVMGPKTLTKACQTSNEMVNSVHLATRVPALRSRELALLQAVADGNLSAVQRLIKSGTDCNSRNNDHNSALHIACEHDHVAIGLYLIQSGAYIVAANNQGNQALHLAAKGNGTLVSAILKRGGELNAQNSDGWTPLHFAAKANNSDIITQLLECGARWTIRNNGNELPVRVARKALALDAMKVLHGAMKIGPHESLVQQISSYHSAEDSLTRDERSSIYMHQNFPSVVSINFDMDIRVKRQASEIAQSARRGNLAAVEDMLDTGIIPPPDALYLAASESRSKVVEVLADVMEDLDTGVGWAGNALCAAASHTDGHNTMKILLDKGANVNWQGGKYGCPLQTATANYRLENVKLLLSYGADVNAQCGHYGNALTAAARHQTNFEEMATLFLDLGVDIDAQGPGAYGNPLQTAVHRHHVQNVKFLLYHGANPKVEGRFGSALDIARRNLSEEGYVGNRREKDEILFLLTEDELESLAITDE
jgi:ankyrin repeat protein